MIIAIMSAVALLLVILGWGVHKKKWYFLISGYNTMSKQQQEQVNVEGLAKALRTMMYILALLLIVLGILLNSENWNLVSVGATIVTILMIVIPIAFIFYARKFYPNDMTVYGNQSSPKAKKISLAITAVTLVGVGVIVYFSMQPTKIEVTEEHLAISGTYGDDIKWTEMTDVSLQPTMATIKMRTNGSSVGSKAVGNFTLEGGEKAKLFIDKSVKQFIHFKWKDKLYILNEPTEAETIELFKKIEQKMQ